MKQIVTKKCGRCGEIKSLGDFQDRTDYAGKKRSWCIPCQKKYYSDYDKLHREQKNLANRKYYHSTIEKQREKARIKRAKNPGAITEWRRKNPRKHLASVLKRRYGITLESYDEMITRQRGLCKICCVSLNGKSHVDHDHKTGRVRGILCGGCNLAIGLIKDNASIADEMAKYLRDNCD